MPESTPDDAPEQSQVPVPQPMTNEPSVRGKSSDNNWGMLTHLSSLICYLGLPFGWIIAPFVVWQIKRNDIPFVDEHGKEAVNFNISLTIYALAAGLLAIITLGIGLIIAFPVWAVLIIGHITLTILAAVAASRGESYRYPLTIRFIS